MGVNTKSFDNASDMITFSRASGGYGLTKVSYGPELVTNGTFDTDTSGWSALNAVLTIVSGALRVENDGASFGYGYQGFETEAGKVYTFSIDAFPGNQNAVVRIGDNSYGALNKKFDNSLITSPVTLTGQFVATATTTFFRLSTTSNVDGDYANFDNISVKEVTYNSSAADATLKLIYHPNDVPRIEYDLDGTAKGLLVEGARTNSYKYSEDLSEYVWVGSSGTISSINAITSPDGNSTGNLVITGVNDPFSRRQNGLGVDSTISFYAKAQEYSFVFANNDNGAGWVCFDLATESIALGNNGFSGEMTAVGNGWYRCVATFPMLIAGNNAHMAIGVRENFGGTYTASSANGTSGAYIWGAQMEADPFATSYIKTENATATRALDLAEINVSNFINKSAGTFLATFNYSDPTNADNNYVFSGSSNARVFYNNAGNSVWQTYDGSAGTTFGAVDSGEVYKLAVAVKTDSNISTAKNGTIQTTRTVNTALMTSIEAYPLLAIGGASSSSSYQKLNGHIKSITYYPRRLTDAQLQELTT